VAGRAWTEVNGYETSLSNKRMSKKNVKKECQKRMSNKRMSKKNVKKECQKRMSKRMSKKNAKKNVNKNVKNIHCHTQKNILFKFFSKTII
jgi:hypothetical protein